MSEQQPKTPFSHISRSPPLVLLQSYNNPSPLPPRKPSSPPLRKPTASPPAAKPTATPPSSTSPPAISRPLRRRALVSIFVRFVSTPEILERYEIQNVEEAGHSGEGMRACVYDEPCQLLMGTRNKPANSSKLTSEEEIMEQH
ncbi:hypothetical protein ACS0TY_008734 [Phlomoides rotata]